MKDHEIQQRDTRQRRLVYDAVRSRCDHPNADELYLAVREQDDKVSKATVYRNLKLLAENGEITHVRVPGADRYDRELRLHCHIICMNCGMVIDSPLPYVAETDVLVAEQTGFLISRHRTVFEGLCPACRAKYEQEHSDEESKDKI